jgi:serine/threonine-protein kinase
VADDTHMWADSYDRVLDDVFAIQSEIAEAVVGQLGVALLPVEREALTARPTESLEAHQAYLRGIEYFDDPDYAKESWELAVRMFERAVGHDPTFVAAHARLSEAHLALYWFHVDRSPERAEAAHQAALRALELDPDSPEGHRALGTYQFQGHRDYQLALEEYNLAAKRLPNDSLIVERIAYVRRRQGHFDEAIAGLETALKLDPQNAGMASEHAYTYQLLRQHREADRYYDLSIALAPNQTRAYAYKAGNLISAGSLERARAALKLMPRVDAPDYFGGWVRLERFERNYHAALDHLAAAPEKVFDTWWPAWKPTSEADLQRFLNQPEQARASYEAALAVLEGRAKETREDDWRLHMMLGHVYSGLGRKAEAIREAKHAVALLPVSKDALYGVFPLSSLAIVYTIVGEHEAAIEKLEYLLSIPSGTTVWTLRLNPIWDPLRAHPRFKKLVGEDWQAEASP